MAEPATAEPDAQRYRLHGVGAGAAGRRGRPGLRALPLVPGHEWSGVIEAVGPGVTGLQPGQPVIAEGIIPDRVCAECVQGNTNLCVVYDELGFTRAGTAAAQVLLPAQVVHVLSGSRRPARGGPGRARRRGLAGHRPRPAEAGGAGRGRR